MQPTTSFIRFILLLALMCSTSRAFAVNLNLPYGTLNSDFSVKMRVGTFPNLIRSAPRPVLPPGPLPSRFHGNGVFVLDLNTVRGTVNAARILRSTGSKQVDDVLIQTLQQWRIQPRTIYKLHVPVRVIAPGKFVFGSP